MAYSQSDLDALDAAIVGGTKRVKIDGREVEYRDLKEMQEIRSMIANSLATGAGGSKSKSSLVSFSKG